MERRRNDDSECVCLATSICPKIPCNDCISRGIVHARWKKGAFVIFHGCGVVVLKDGL